MRLEYCVSPTSKKVFRNQQRDVKKMPAILTGYIWDNFKISKEWDIYNDDDNKDWENLLSTVKICQFTTCAKRRKGRRNVLFYAGKPN